MASSSELLLDASDVMALVDPTDRGMDILSPWPARFQDHEEPARGESKAIEKVELRLDGGSIGFWDMVGEESGEGCSAMVEW